MQASVSDQSARSTATFVRRQEHPFPKPIRNEDITEPIRNEDITEPIRNQDITEPIRNQDLKTRSGQEGHKINKGPKPEVRSKRDSKAIGGTSIHRATHTHTIDNKQRTSGPTDQRATDNNDCTYV